jgi:hypothetical protein
MKSNTFLFEGNKVIHAGSLNRDDGEKNIEEQMIQY